MADEARVKWNCLFAAPLAYSFLQQTMLSPGLGTDVVINPENPILYFVGYLLSSVAMYVFALAFPGVRVLVRKIPVVVCPLVFMVGTALTYVHVALGFGSVALLFVGGVIAGLASAVLFVLWFLVFSNLDAPGLYRVAALVCVFAYLLFAVFSRLITSAGISLLVTFIAVFVSAIPLERLGRGGFGKSSEMGFSSERGLLSELRRSVLVLGGVFVAYLITGFSWGNALFNAYEYLEPSLSTRGWGELIGAMMMFFVALVRPELVRNEWISPVAVGMLLAGWLAAVSFPQGIAIITSVFSGVAFGMLDVALFVWVGEARLHGGSIWNVSALAGLVICLPIALGIALAPLVHGTVATLASPLCSIIYFVALQVTGLCRARLRFREDVAEGMRYELLEKASQAGLSARETDVFLMLAHGYSSGYIAEKLGLSAYTVKTHAKHIYAKVGVHTKDELLAAVRFVDGEGAGRR